MPPPPPDPQFLLEHRAFMVAIARGLLGDADRAEDVAQEGLLAALGASPRSRGWFATVARNLSWMRVRGDTRREARERRAARPEAVGDPTDGVARMELHKLIVEHVLALPEPYRSTVIARYFDDLSVREIAESQGVSRDTVKTRLRRAMVRLRERLDAEHGGDTKAWSSLLVPFAFAKPSVGGAAAGVTIMTTKTTLGLGLVATLLIALLLGWQLREPEGAPRAQPSEASRRAPAPLDGSAPAAADAPPAPVDLAAVDIHRDLHGRVVDSSGSPIAGARIEVLHAPWDRVEVLARFPAVSGAATTSSVDGTFRITLRRGAQVNLRVESDGFAPVEIRRLQAGERVQVVLSPPSVLTVEVRDAERKPIEGARVSVMHSGDGIWFHDLARTDEAGSAHFANLPAGEKALVDATHPLHGGIFQSTTARVGDRVTITLPRGVTFSGRVVDAETGAPVPDARVGMGWVFDPETRTDADGRFRINGFMGGNVYHAIHVLADGYMRVHVPVRRPAAAKELLVRLGLGATLVGRVVDFENKPLAGARVAAIGEGAGIADGLSLGHATTDREGRFRIAGLDKRLPHTLSVTATGHARATRAIAFAPEDGATTDLEDIRLAQPRTVEGVLLDRSAKPVPRHKVTVRGPRGGAQGGGGPGLYARGNEEERRTDDRGRFRFPDLPAGQYLVSARRPGGTGIEQRVEVGRSGRAIAWMLSCSSRSTGRCSRASSRKRASRSRRSR
ncbi:MAG: sigma-70 family RNA polymerase sigma factor [Planctomycetota bacterium]|jgi:RNA polymerase sigma-70 factor (ECF subfamily)